MNKNIVPNSFIAISDFHGYDYPIEKIKNYYLNEYDKIFILGDATDRGLDLQGKNGLSVLFKIKELCDKYPKKIFYIPGNHDSFLYEYGKYDSILAKEMLMQNNQYTTIKDIDALKAYKSNGFKSLLNWLGKQPLQKVHIYNGKTYVFAHAFFNLNIFKSNYAFNLDDYARLGFNPESKEYQILWFRPGNKYDPMDVPPNVIEIIGHTPEKLRKGKNLDLINSSGTYTDVYCVDGGISYGDEMLKFDGDYYSTQPVKHSDTSPKINSISNRISKLKKINKTLKIMDDAIYETISKHGVDQAYTALGSMYLNKDNWLNYFSRENRDNIRKLKRKNIIDVLLYFSIDGSVESGIFEFSNSVNKKVKNNQYKKIKKY